MSEPVRVAVDAGVATVTLNRPEARNAISTELAIALAAAFEPLTTDRAVRAVVLTGAGDRAFCAGADLRERGGFDDHQWFVQREAFRRAFGAVRRCPLPTVAAVFGYAQIAGNAPTAVRLAKWAIDLGADLAREAGLEVEDQAWRRAVKSADRREGIAAWNERRPPIWPGE